MSTSLMKFYLPRNAKLTVPKKRFGRIIGHEEKVASVINNKEEVVVISGQALHMDVLVKRITTIQLVDEPIEGYTLTLVRPDNTEVDVVVTERQLIKSWQRQPVSVKDLGPHEDVYGAAPTRVRTPCCVKLYADTLRYRVKKIVPSMVDGYVTVEMNMSPREYLVVDGLLMRGLYNVRVIKG